MNQAFYDIFKVKQDETIGRLFYESLGNGQWNIPELRTLLEDVLPKNKEVRAITRGVTLDSRPSDRKSSSSTPGVSTWEEPL